MKTPIFSIIGKIDLVVEHNEPGIVGDIILLEPLSYKFRNIDILSLTKPDVYNHAFCDGDASYSLGKLTYSEVREDDNLFLEVDVEPWGSHKDKKD